MSFASSPASCCAPSSSSSPSSAGPRTRRKREAIELPADVEGLDPAEVKRIKNRIAAARLRERSQRQIRELEAQVAQLRARNAALEAAAAGCARCSALRATGETDVCMAEDKRECVDDDELERPLCELTDVECSVLQELLEIW